MQQTNELISGKEKRLNTSMKVKYQQGAENDVIHFAMLLYVFKY